MPVVWSKNGIDIIVHGPPREKHRLPHVHVKAGGRSASIAIGTGEILANTGFSERVLSVIVEVVEANRDLFLEHWAALHGE